MRLSVKEAHVYVMQGLQRQGAFKKDKQYTQSTDLAINTALSRFIRGRLKPSPSSNRYEIDEPSRNDLQSLIVVNEQLKVFKEGDYFYAQLPYDFKYLLNDRSSVLEDCKASFPSAITSLTETINVFQLIDSPLTTPNFYKNIQVSCNGQTRALSYPNGLETKDDKYLLVEQILAAFKETSALAYWERYKGTYRPESFIVIGTNPTLTIDGGTVGVSNVSNQVSKPQDTLTEEYSPVANRNTKNDFIHNLLQSEYSGPFVDSPVSTVSNGRITVYTTKRFLITKLFIDYVRVPKPVNLLLNQGFETHEDTHDRICDLAVEIMKDRIEDQSLSTSVQRNNLRAELN